MRTSVNSLREPIHLQINPMAVVLEIDQAVLCHRRYKALLFHNRSQEKCAGWLRASLVEPQLECEALEQTYCVRGLEVML